MGNFWKGVGTFIAPITTGISSLVHDAKHEGGMLGHNSQLSNFWHEKVEPYATELWNAFTGKTDRDFAREQADTAFERQKWLIENQPSMEADARRRAGYSSSFSGSNIGTVASPQMASANRLSPSIGDLTDMFTGIFSNVLGARKVDAEIKNLDADTEKKGTESQLNSAKIQEVQSVVKVNSQTARNLVAMYDNIVEENKVLGSKDEMQLALASLYRTQSNTELWKQKDYDSQIKLRDKQSESIDWQIKQLKYNLEVILPREADKILSQIHLNDTQSEQIKLATGRILQDIIMNRPNVAHAMMNFDQIVKTLGAKNAVEYLNALSDSMDARIDMSKKAMHPALNLHSGNKLNDSMGYVYVMLMSAIQNISQDLSSGLGAGLGLKGLLKH